MWGGFQNLLRSSLSFVEGNEGSNEEKNGEEAEGGGSRYRLNKSN